MAVFAAVFVGCAPHYGDTYEVRIDPTFTAEQTQKVLAAMDDWSLRTPVWLTSEIANCSGLYEHIVCVHSTDHAGVVAHSYDNHSLGVTVLQDNIDGAEIWVDAPILTQQTAGHELGHAMGLQHWGPGTGTPTTEPVIMAPNSRDASPVVTCNDVMQWYSVRGRVVPSCGD